MFLLRRSFLKIILTVTVSFALQACASADKRVSLIYAPKANVKGGSGELYLVQEVRQPPSQAAAIQWVLGDVKDDEGKKMGKVVSDVAPASLVQDALARELSEAGYRVRTVDAMPAGVEKGLSLKDVVMKLDQVHNAFNDDVSSSVRMSVQPWRKGAAVSTLEYQAESSETAVSDRDRLASKSLQKTLQLLMSRAVPEVVKTLEQK